MRHQTLVSAIMAALILTACGTAPDGQKDRYPMFWTWLDYTPGMDFETACATMEASGIDGVMLNAPTPDDYRAAIPIARRHGIEVYAWLWTMNLEHDRETVLREHPEWLSVNREGRSLADTIAYVPYYKFLCPALPEVRDYIRQKVEAYCEVEGLGGIAIDYHRFVDAILPTTLWPRYGIVQDKEYAEWDFGYHPALIEGFRQAYGYDPRERDDPSGDDQWLRYRCDQITAVANEIAEVAHAHGKIMAASPFPTPRMAARMVRQDWSQWDLDIVFPMVYHPFYTGDVSFVSDCMIEDVRDKNPRTTLYCGLMVGDDICAAMDAALNHGAEGISIFTISALESPEARTRFRAYTDSVRAVRKRHGGVNPALSSGTKITDPFENMRILGMINERIKELCGMPIPNIAGYKLVREEGYTKYYEVEELNTHKTYHVNFYFYGGIFSGWSVNE